MDEAEDVKYTLEMLDEGYVQVIQEGDDFVVYVSV